MSENEASSLPVVLVVDDKRNMLSLMAKVLSRDARVLAAASGAEAVRLLAREPVDVVLSDLRMPDLDGLDVLRQCKRLRPQAEFVLMTAHASVATAVEALRLGAYDYLTKPFEPDAARTVVLRAIGRATTALPGVAGTVGAAESAENESGPASAEILPAMLGRSRGMQELAAVVKRIAESDATTLLLGETGTGKERIARAIHQLSPRSGGRFVAVNCSAIPAELIESELFGYAKGAFTGAGRDRAGLFEEADGGTLFLDEIGDMRLSLQARLTRVLEERAVRRVGEAHERPVDVRVVAATHRNVENMVQNETFREDLWYRLNVAVVRIPPLRERRDDIELLAAHFLRERVIASNRRIVGFTGDAIAAMEGYDWPGNVRQLRAAVERACVVSTQERVDVGDLPPEVVRADLPAPPAAESFADLTWHDALEAGRIATGRAYLREVLERHHGQVAAAAAHAGVERESFYRLMRRYNVSAGPS